MVQATYDHIYVDLRESIESGAFPYGSLLPSQAVLVRRYGCAHNTVRKALALLAQQGYCQPIHGKGVRVIWHPEDGHTPFATGGFEENGAFVVADEHSGEVKVFEIVECDDPLAKLTGFTAGTSLRHIVRTNCIDDVPRVLFEGYFPAREIRSLTREQAAGALLSYFDSWGDLRFVTSKQLITFERADERDTELLELDGSDRVAVLRIRSFSPDASPCAYVVVRYHPDFFRFHDTILHEI